MGRRPIWLVGMMGAGKSAVGPRLAQSLGRHFTDTDVEIERSTQMAVSNVFASEGERAFRERERQVIANLVDGCDVVALGGGAIAQPGAADLLGRTGTVIYLKASPASLLGRLGDCSNRPLLAGLAPDERLARIDTLLAERARVYETALIQVETDERSVETVVAEIVRRLGSSDLGDEGGVAKGVGV